MKEMVQAKAEIRWRKIGWLRLRTFGFLEALERDNLSRSRRGVILRLVDGPDPFRHGALAL